MIHCVSLDFDWTLAEMRPQTYELCQEVLDQKYGYFFELEVIKEKFAATIEELPEEIQKKVFNYARLSIEDQQQLLRDFNRLRLVTLDISSSEIESCLIDIEKEQHSRQKRVLYEDVLELLEELYNRAIDIFIVSGNTYSRIERTLKENNVLQFFSEIYTPDRYNLLKKELYPLLLEKTGLLPELILHCGDHEEDDIAAALSYGFKAVLIRRPSHYYQKVKNNSFPIVQSLSELKKFL